MIDSSILWDLQIFIRDEISADNQEKCSADNSRPKYLRF